MVEKRLLCPHRRRRTPGQFSWLDHRLVRERRLERCPVEAWALYLFLVTVADARGLSYYSDASLTARLPRAPRCPPSPHRRRPHRLRPPLYQVLSLDEHAPAEPPPPRSATPRRLSEVLEQLRRPT